MKVENKITPSTINGRETNVGNDKFLYIRNVWNRDKMIEIQFDNETSITVYCEDLSKAIKNAIDNKD